ncbi:MAG: siphovirus Gp157 family protein [Chloroflexi bacterium]|nr:siphovirus Gp157 family protein [Chloroflexota bacterium]
MKLYQLTEAYQRLLEANEDGEFAAALEALAEEFDQRAEGLAKVIRALEGEADVFDTEAKRLLEHARSRHNRAEHLKEYLRQQMEALGKGQVKGTLFTVSLQASPPRCEVVDAAVVPDQYQVVIPATVRVDAKAIIEYWRETGEQVPGAVVSQGKHVRIR